MPTYAVMLRYEVVSGLIIEAGSEDEAAQIATEFEAEANDAVGDTDAVQVSMRLSGEGTLDCQSAGDRNEAEDLLDDWLEDLDEDFGDDTDDDTDDTDDEDNDDEDLDEFEIVSSSDDDAERRRR